MPVLHYPRKVQQVFAVPLLYLQTDQYETHILHGYENSCICVKTAKENITQMKFWPCSFPASDAIEDCAGMW